MSKYTFTWEHPAQEVYVTGTFDGWEKTVKLEKDGSIFKKTVSLPKVHTQYKFVVDGNWCINESARKEEDGAGITNNVLVPEDFTDEPVSALSSVAPHSSTAALAGAVPKVERTTSTTSPVPGAFPMTPAAETPGSEPQTFNISPIPATEGLGNPIKLAPGEPVPAPSTFTDNTVQSTVQHDKGLQEPSTFGVAPIPATAGAGNPIHLAPGEKVPDPSTLTSNTIQSTVQKDVASYEKSDALPPMNFTPQAERDARGGMFDLPPVAGNMIPESSLPMGVDAKTEQDTGVTIQSAAPTSTTAALAGLVPKEPHGVPEPVLESQKEAAAAPEASANPEAVQDKQELEQELKDKVPEVPATSNNSLTSNTSSGAKTVAATTAAGITAGAAAIAAAVYSTKDKAAETVGQNGSTTTGDIKAKAAEITGLNGSTTTGDVPVRVVESQKEAHVSPEAASNPEAVHEKSQVEQELLSEIPKVTGTGLAAPAIAVPAVVSESQKEAHASPEAAAYGEVVAEKKAVESELLKEIPKTNEASEPAPVLTAATTEFAPGTKTETATNVPEVVAESQEIAHARPEAASNAEAVTEKKVVETELLKEVKATDATGESAPTATDATTTSTPAVAPSTELNAPASLPAQPATSKATEPTKDAIIPEQTPATAEQSKPTVTTGAETTTTEPQTASLATPAKEERRDSEISPKGTPGSPSLASAATDDKKKKRRSIFGKLKEKFSSKHDK